MPSIQDMLRPPIVLETPQERDARMAEFHKRFPALGLAAVRETGRFVQENADHDPEDGTLYWEPRDE